MHRNKNKPLLLLLHVSSIFVEGSHTRVPIVVAVVTKENYALSVLFL